MQQQTAKNFSMGIDKMLQHVSLVKNLYREDKAAFETRYSAIFDPDYEIRLTDLINQGYTIHGDEHARSTLVMNSSELRDIVKKFRAKHQDVEVIIKKGLKGNNHSLRLLGINTLSEMTETPSSLVLAIGRFLVTLRKFFPELQQYGLTEQDIEDFVQIEKELQGRRDELDLTKINRSEMTKERVSLYNTIWETAKDIMDSADAVLSPARAAKYKVPYQSKSDSVTENGTIQTTASGEGV